MKYISSESEDIKEMGEEFLRARDKVIEAIEEIPTNQRFALLMMLALDAAMLTKYEDNKIDSEAEILIALSTLWTGPIKRVTQRAAMNHVEHLEKTKGTKH